MGMKRLIFGCLALLLAAPALAADLYIDLRTNWEPRVEFRYVRVEVIDRSDERKQWRTLHFGGGDFERGQRVAEFTDVRTRHNYLVQVELLDHRLRPIDGKVVLLAMPDTHYAWTIVIARP